MKKLFLFFTLSSSLCLSATEIQFRGANLTDEHGTPQFLAGTEYSYVAGGKIKLYGKLWRGKYPERYRYLYETSPCQAYFESIGFNTLHITSFPLVISALFPDYTPAQLSRIFEFYQEGLIKHNLGAIKKMWGIQPYRDFMAVVDSLKTMPYYIDLYSGALGVLTSNRKAALTLLPEEALADPGAHSYFSIRYNLGHPAGREAVKKVFQLEMELFRNEGAHPYMYKIFNEPNYRNYSPHNVKHLPAWLKKKFGTVEAMNRAWNSSYPSFDAPSPLPKSPQYHFGAAIEYAKLQEKQLVDLAVELRQLVRSIDKKPVILQLLGGEHAMSIAHGCNIFELQSRMDAITPGTGNFCFDAAEDYNAATPFRETLAVSRNLKIALLRHALYYPLAKDKVYLNTEAYIAENKADNFQAVLWRELALGRQQVLFWSWFGMEPPGKRMPKFSLLNPGVQQPQELEAIPRFRKALAPIADLFLDRKNKLFAPQVAFLYSNPTLRVTGITGNQTPRLFATLPFLAALHFRHVDFAGVFEENLAAELDRYKILILGDVTHISEETHKQLKQYLDKGGILVAMGGEFRQSEYGVPFADPLIDFRRTPQREMYGRIPEFDIPASLKWKISTAPGWEVRGTLNGAPAVLRKRFGKGELWFLNADIGDYALTAVLDPLLKQCDIRPYATVLKPDQEEPMPNIEVFPFRKRTAHGELNGYLLFNQNRESCCFRIAAPGIQDTVFEPVSGELYPVENGFVTVRLSNRECRVLVAGDKAEWMKRFPAPTEKSPEQLRKETEQLVRKERLRAPFRKSFPLDLKAVANSGFDNAQKWATDSALVDSNHRYLSNVPFHTQRFGDLFFDIIRFDFNDNRSCLALRSKRNPEYPAQVTVPVGRKCGDFAILQTCVGGKPGDAVLKYRIRYADGTVQEKTAVKGVEIGDWKIDANPAALQKTAVWSDEERYGFFLYELPNPFPSKTVVALELLSCEGDGTAVICAISALETIFTREYAHSVSFKELFPVLKQPTPDERNGWFGDEFRSDRNYVEFATQDGKPHPLFDTPEKIDRAVLRGSVRLDRDATGKKHNLSWLSMVFPGSHAKLYMRSLGIISNCTANRDGDHWMEFEVPLKELRGKDVSALTGFVLFPGRQTEVVKHFRNLRLEY